jgi:acetoin utilization protein AcuB
MVALPAIESAMSSYPYSIEIGSHANSARSMLKQFGIHHLPVTEGEQLIGVITSWGIERAIAQGWDISVGSSTLVRDIYSHEVLVVAPETPLPEVLKRMADEHAEATLITRDGKLIGIFTMTDACRRYAQLLLNPPPATGHRHS